MTNLCLERLSSFNNSDIRLLYSQVTHSHYTQIIGGGKACVYKLRDYCPVLKCLKNSKDIDVYEIPWTTFNVVERLSHSFTLGRWMPCRPEHLSDEKVDELMQKLPDRLLNRLLPFQLDGVRFGLQRGGRCLIADEMGLGKTLQVLNYIQMNFCTSYLQFCLLVPVDGAIGMSFFLLHNSIC